jgi:phospholipid N-methyltransferase
MENPREVGAIAPSSRFLTKEIIRNVDFKTSKNIIELGPGLGTFTKEILKRAKPDANLFCFEVNKRFCDYLEKNITDKRLKIINAGAERISRNLKRIKADCVISGLPFLNFSDSKKKKILQEINNSLNGNGRFVLFQYTNGIGRLLSSYFKKVNRRFVPLNMPPSFVYVCEK